MTIDISLIGNNKGRAVYGATKSDLDNLRSSSGFQAAENQQLIYTKIPMFRIHPDMVDEIVIVDTGSTDRTKERNLRIYEKLLSTGKQFAPRDLQHYARELHHHKLYEKAIEYYLKFMDLDDASAEDKIFVCGKLADCYYQLGNKEKELAFTFKSFEYDVPRPDFCCRLGFHFLQKNEFHQARSRVSCSAPLFVNRTRRYFVEIPF